MDKSDFKKMALMGMAGGMLLVSQSPVNAEAANNVGVMMAQSCGAHSCSGQPQPPTGPRYSDRGSCGGANPQPNGPRYSDRGSCGAPQPNRGYTADNFDDQSRLQSSTSYKKVMTESELMSQLNSEGKTTFQGLDAEGKALALKFANQYDDKNFAVKMAANKMAERRSGVSNDMNTSTYSGSSYNSTRTNPDDTYTPGSSYNSGSSYNR